MGLTAASTGGRAAVAGLKIHRRWPGDRIIALAGNPNVGKSTLFNALTGLHQHTGNWPGKTVVNAQGSCVHRGQDFLLVDLPGTYSLLSRSEEEQTARDFLCFGGVDGAVVVCDATCLERNLNLALQVLETGVPTVVCVNLLDEAERKGVQVDLSALSRALGVPVIGTSAGQRRGLTELMDAVSELSQRQQLPRQIRYPAPVEYCTARLARLLDEPAAGLNPRWAALRLLEGDGVLLAQLEERLALERRPEFQKELDACRAELSGVDLTAALAETLVRDAGRVASATVCQPADASHRDRLLDRILTSRRTGIPVMLLLLAGVFWLTIVGANYPSQWLSELLFGFQDVLTGCCEALGVPGWVHGALVLGMYRVLAWVVSVMLPPMAIFFPLFTLLEDFGYLPRVAFVLDHAFQKAQACGKQALTMCMGFGCNAAGVVGCRIIDSPRERLIAMLTNSFVPCNGRFPTLISILTMFFVGTSGGLGRSLACAALLLALVLLGIGMTFLFSRALSATLLKGEPSSFALELPPYRKPQIGRVLVRSVLDRTLFVLGRAAAVAAPAGLLIWVMANVTVQGESMLNLCAGFLDPFARLLGLDGVILMAFILGFPANEIVMPIVIMAYLSTGTLTGLNDLGALHTLLAEHGWTWLTAVCTMLFSLFHWPCSTTCLTIHKESGSWKWTAVGLLLPTLAGMLACFLTAALARGVGLA